MSAQVENAAEQSEVLDCPTLDEVLSLATVGFRVFPLARNSKLPALEANPNRIATNEPEKVRDLWVCKFTGWIQPYNVGVAPNAGVLVVDVDVRDGKRGDEALAELERTYGQLPQTYTVRTPSGGFHHYFRSPPGAGPFKRELAEHVDLKSADGYVVGEGSTIDGKRYTRAAGEPDSLTDAPEWLVELARRPPDAPRTIAVGVDADDLDSPSAIARAIDYLKRAPDHGTYKVACRVKDFGISPEKCWELLCEHWDEAQDLGKGPEHIRVRVDNAYKFGKSPIGVASAEMEFDAVELERPTPTRSDDPQNIMTFAGERSHGYLVKGLLNFGMTGFITGLPNAGKTPLALDLGAHVAKGEPWRGMRVKPAYVLCIATEGWTGFKNRMTAVRNAHFDGRLGEAPFEFETRELDLVSSPRDAEALIEKIIRRAAHFGLKPGLVIIDTLSHTLAGGDDSEQATIRPALKNIARIISATGATVLATHHPTKAGTSDTRGSSIITFDTDLLIKVEADDKRKLSKVTTPRTKDYGQLRPMYFRNRVVEIGKDEDGDPVTTVIAEWQADAEDEFAIGSTPEQDAALHVLQELESARMSDSSGTEAPGIGTVEWRDAYFERAKNKANRARSPSHFRGLANALKEAGRVIPVCAANGTESLWKSEPRQPRKTAQN